MKQPLIYTHLFFLLFSFGISAQDNQDTNAIRNSLDAYISTRASDPRKAMEYLHSGLSVAGKLNDSSRMAVLLYHKGYLYRMMGIYDLAIKSYLQSVMIYEKLQDQNLLAWLYIDIGNLYFAQKSKLPFALEHYRKAEWYFTTLKNTEGVIVSSYNIGMTLRDQSRPDSALHYFSKALHLSEQSRDTVNEALSLSYIGQTYLGLKQFPAAVKYFDSSFHRNVLIKDTAGIAYSHRNYASLFAAQSDMDRALKSHLVSLDFYRAVKDKANISSQLESVGKLYGEKGEYRKAVEYALASFRVADSAGLLTQKQNVLIMISESYSKLGMHREAYAYLHKYNAIKESLINRNLEHFQTEYELETRQRETRFLQKEKELKDETIRRQDIIIYISLAALSLLVIMLSIIVVSKKRLKESYEHLYRSNVEIMKRESEIQEIRKSNRYSGSSLSPEQHEVLLNDLMEAMLTHKVYLDNSLTIEDLAKRLNTNRTYLSQIINEKLQTNFNNFINEYRIREAQRILLEGADKYTIEGIARSAGFNSKSSFHAAFKKVTGLTPSEYIRQKSQQ